MKLAFAMFVPVVGVLCAADALAQKSGKLEAPVLVEADGVPIDTGKSVGHSGPIMRDHDGDGLPDLLVSSFGGDIRFFKNVGSRTEPKFEEGNALETGGEPIRIHNW